MVDFAIANFTANQCLAWMLHRPWAPFPGWENWASWVPNLGLPFSSAHFDWTLNSQCTAGYEAPIRFETVLGRNDGMKLLVCEGLLIDIVSQNTLSVSGKRRQLHEIVLASPELAEDVARMGGLRMEEVRKTSYNSIIFGFPEASPIPGLTLSRSSSHRYGNDNGLRQALVECFGHMDLRPRNPEESVFDIPRSVLEKGREANSDELLAGPTIQVPVPDILRDMVELFNDLNLWGQPLKHLWLDRPSGETRVPELTLNSWTALLARIFTACTGYVGAAICPLRPSDRIYIIPSVNMP